MDLTAVLVRNRMASRETLAQLLDATPVDPRIRVLIEARIERHFAASGTN